MGKKREAPAAGTAEAQLGKKLTWPPHKVLFQGLCIRQGRRRAFRTGTLTVRERRVCRARVVAQALSKV